MESRKYSTPTYDEPDSEQETDTDYTDDPEFKLDISDIPGSDSSGSNIIDSFMSSLSQLAIPCKGSIDTRALLQSMTATHLIPEDLTTYTR